MKTDDSTIRDQVKERFARVALDPSSETRFELGRASALKLGYEVEVLDAIPDRALASFAGVGNPLAIEPLAAGMTVLDLGCGSGVDTIIASRAVGPCGQVVGVDMTPAMAETAAAACSEAGCTNVEIRVGLAHEVELDAQSVDVVISNGVVNLCPDKPTVVAETYRMLAPGGRLQIADMSLVDGVNPELLERVGEWSD